MSALHMCITTLRFLHQFHPWKEFWLVYILDLHPLCQTLLYTKFKMIRIVIRTELKYFSQNNTYYWCYWSQKRSDKNRTSMKKQQPSIHLWWCINTQICFKFTCLNLSAPLKILVWSIFYTVLTNTLSLSILKLDVNTISELTPIYTALILLKSVYYLFINILLTHHHHLLTYLSLSVQQLWPWHQAYQPVPESTAKGQLS